MVSTSTRAVFTFSPIPASVKPGLFTQHTDILCPFAKRSFGLIPTKRDRKNHGTFFFQTTYLKDAKPDIKVCLCVVRMSISYFYFVLVLVCRCLYFPLHLLRKRVHWTFMLCIASGRTYLLIYLLTYLALSWRCDLLGTFCLGVIILWENIGSISQHCIGRHVIRNAIWSDAAAIVGHSSFQNVAPSLRTAVLHGE